MVVILCEITCNNSHHAVLDVFYQTIAQEEVIKINCKKDKIVPVQARNLYFSVGLAQATPQIMSTSIQYDRSLIIIRGASLLASCKSMIVCKYLKKLLCSLPLYPLPPTTLAAEDSAVPPRRLSSSLITRVKHLD